MTTKKITLKLASAVFALSLLSFSGCKKDKNNDSSTVEPTPTPAPTKTEQLTGKNWKLTSWTSDPAIDWGGGAFVTDVYAQLDACQKDDIFIYNTNGTYLEDYKVQCPGDPASSTGTWVFNSTQTIITTDAGTANSSDFTLLQLDGSYLKGTIVYSTGSLNYTFTITYTRQ